MDPIEIALSKMAESVRRESGRHIVADSATVLEGLECLNSLSGQTMTLFVVNNEGKLTGTLTDGDLRRALISGKKLKDTLGEVCNRGCLRLEETAEYDGSEDSADKVNRFIQVSLARKKGISLLPVVSDGYIVDVLDLKKMKTVLPLDAVLMAGGRGERLRPLTNDTPKPLLPIGDKPIIDYNIEELIANGVRKIFITVNYLKEQIVEHIKTRFEPESRVSVSCVAEPRRLGTMGSLALVEDLIHDDVLVMNSDLLTNINFEQMYVKHLESGALVTMAVVPYTVSVPFAIIEHSSDRVTGLSEKPTFNYYANAGIYILKRSVVDKIRKNEYLDAPDLIDSLIQDGGKVSYFPIEGTWIDIGSPDDYRAAREMTGAFLKK